MKTIAKLLPALFILSTASAYAARSTGPANGAPTADNETSMTYSEAAPSERRGGFDINYMYMNVTDASITFTNNTTGYHLKDSYGTGHVGLQGVNLGYKLLQPRKWGFDLGLNFLKPMNPSESDASVNIYQAEGNLNYSFNSLLHAYFGANVSYFNGGSSDTRISPGLGLQAGLGLQKNGFQLMAGYNIISVSRHFDSKELGTDGSLDAQVLLSGFAAQVGYLF